MVVKDAAVDGAEDVQCRSILARSGPAVDPMILRRHGFETQSVDEVLVHRFPDLQRARPAVKMINIFMISILLIGTCDTKADEILFLKSRI